MIVATAGHIDHGKTLLVKALTGVDADRLPEEKKRGMTLDLGFAYTDLENGARLGFIDVPGHERLVHNMLAGVTGIDCALLVVAADDGPMPQTLEHLAILNILGISRGMVALTKIDRVDPARVEEVQAEIELLIGETSLAGAPIYPVSAISGDGIPALRERVADMAAETEAKSGNGHFRLAVDRVFTVAGAGLVVTGTAFAGTVAREDRLWISGHDSQVRVRGIHANNQDSETGRAGDRLALNITGLDKDDIVRGDWLVADPGLALHRKLDVRLHVVTDAKRPLRHWTPVHVHLGARNVTGRVAILGAENAAPGSSVLAQLVLDAPVGACVLDRFVIRDQSAQFTLGGGHVVDLHPPRRGRAKPERPELLAALDTSDPVAAFAAALERSPTGVSIEDFAAARNLTEAEKAAVLKSTTAVVTGEDATALALSPATWAARQGELLAALDQFHERYPDRLGPAAAQLRKSLGRYIPEPLFDAITARLVADKTLSSDGMLLHRPDHQPGLTGDDAKRWDVLQPLLNETPESPPVVHDLAQTAGLPVNGVGKTLRQAVRMGLAVQIAENRFFTPAALRAHAQTFETMIAAEGVVGVSPFRQQAGIGRNLAVEVLEYFDRIGLSRRDGNARHQVRPAAEVFGN
ncbi:MAG: selenocysteine-specific translation elongation factor [Rhodospirillaceae bacterium]|jgi:selenocysteine-specific elongation factor|nr:selenocysteine-specific translation elongation factor [Rhodospirillaceae bacterium]MBT4773274.1 selenocysteine-specific translation elongation factor [Rhodospirillaceae bacterium]MBT5356935.1 selenocysteine-specific translation elongation factor [Rhodospirillaceae bacterium]MBT5770002.1 selenocysteine-specific translation elongation factor [Rhodospirillaceae bacterium]MBT6308431.1 selenocysteine-specific translation elongation factor [Rhodospirillaceae bacterium]